jgi:hypothetical protein
VGQSLLVLEHLGEVTDIDPAAAGRASEVVLGLGGDLAVDTLAHDLTAVGGHSIFRRGSGDPPRPWVAATCPNIAAFRPPRAR